MDKSIGFNKEELKNKFDIFYKDGRKWSFNTKDKMYITKKELIKPYIDKVATILDLGCAEGDFLSSIVEDKQNKTVVGVDISEFAISLAKAKNFYDELYVGFINDTGLYTKNTKTFDLVLLNEVLYYVENYIQTLQEVLSLNSKYIFVSLAMGPKFFNSLDAKRIENVFKSNGYTKKKKVIYDMNYKFGVPYRYLSKIYEILTGNVLKQTHKYIYI